MSPFVTKIIGILILIGLFGGGYYWYQNTNPTPVTKSDTNETNKTGNAISPGKTTENIQLIKLIKDVGEPMYKHLGLTDSDFIKIKTAGFNTIEGNFDICQSDSDVRYFLDSADKHGLKVILNAGAGEAEWGYPCDGNFNKNLKPTWQKERVRTWVNKWKNHPALLMWDTSNEDGGVFPFGTGGVDPDPEWETKYALSEAQLRQAYVDVKSFDPNHKVMIRMNGWYFYDNADNFFRPGNYFGKGVADVVMINAYSNVDEYFDDFVSTVMTRASRSIYAIDPNVSLLPSLGVWAEPPMWFTPSKEHLINDWQQAMKSEKLIGISVFKYGASEGNDWLLPDSKRGDALVWSTLTTLLSK